MFKLLFLLTIGFGGGWLLWNVFGFKDLFRNPTQELKKKYTLLLMEQELLASDAESFPADGVMAESSLFLAEDVQQRIDEVDRQLRFQHGVHMENE